MINANTARSESGAWRFAPKVITAPFSAAETPQGYRAAQQQEALIRQNEYYGTSFPPALYAKLRAFVQTKGWNDLLDGVTFRSGDRIADLGFGDGGNTAQLAKDLRENGLDCRIFGVEKDPNMVKAAREAYPESENRNLIFIEGAAEQAGGFLGEHLRREDQKLVAGSIRWVISNYTLHWVRDPKAPMNFLHQAMFSSLNPLQPIGGHQRHLCAHEHAFKELFEAGYTVIKRDSKWAKYFELKEGDYAEKGEWRHPPLITEQGILRDLDLSGYSGSAELRVDERVFPSVDLLKAWVKTMIRPFMNRIPEENKQDFVDVWIGQYVLDTQQHKDHPVKLWDRNVLVVARKDREIDL